MALTCVPATSLAPAFLSERVDIRRQDATNVLPPLLSLLASSLRNRGRMTKVQATFSQIAWRQANKLRLADVVLEENVRRIVDRPGLLGPAAFRRSRNLGSVAQKGRHCLRDLGSPREDLASQSRLERSFLEGASRTLLGGGRRSRKPHLQAMETNRGREGEHVPRHNRQDCVRVGRVAARPVALGGLRLCWTPEVLREDCLFALPWS